MPETTITQDASGKKLEVVRDFNAPLPLVWRAWTEAELLDRWWAPKPWKAETKSMDFREGGLWLYSMNGPEGERHWCRSDFSRIEPRKSFQSVNQFCDENGTFIDTAPPMKWSNHFHDTGTGTRVVVKIAFDSRADLATIVEMGFQEGFTAALENLDRYLEEHGKQ